VRARGLSLWLVPGGAAGVRLAGRIETLARALETPVFAPHVTLVGGVVRPEREVRAACADLARALPSVTIRLGAIEARQDYFRCVVVRVAESGPLRRARVAATRALGVAATAFAPHLSLVYGDLSTGRRAAARRLAAAAGRGGFLARRLELWRTAGEVREWRLVAAWRLEGRRSELRPRRAGART
jgi:hypothetical protein